MALHSGLFVRHDAVSDSLRHKLDILTGLRDEGHPVDARVFTIYSDLADWRIRQAQSVNELVRMPEFWAADIHVFEVGPYYALFDSIIVIPEDRRIMAVYHNLTPLELIDSEHNRIGTERSMVQLYNLWWAHHIANDSEFNRDELAALGLPRSRLSVLHLPPSLALSHERRGLLSERPASEPIRLLFVGRLVRAKGILDLLAASRLLRLRGVPRFVLTMVGKKIFAERPVLDAIESAGPELEIELRADADQGELEELYRSSDALVIPSYHEGYCVPVVEAFSSGCYVIAADGGNLPNVVGGLGSVVCAGDVAGLAGAIGDFLTSVSRARTERCEAVLRTGRGEMRESDWRKAVARHVDRYSAETYERTFLARLHELAEGLPGGSPDWLRSAAGQARDKAIA